jgi:hypothetical protein
MSVWKSLQWKQAKVLLIDFFDRLGQMQAPDGEVTMTCPLRRLPKTAHFQTGIKKGG